MSEKASPRRTAVLTLGALGVVFGDIGTSPLYAMRESALAAGGTAPAPEAVLGALSLIFWALMIVVTLKYVIFIMQADNDGEGGVLALAALAHRSPGLGRWTKTAIGVSAILGLALFYGDGMLTPAISVLSAVEGLGEGGPQFEPLIMPLSLIILIGLFVLQSRGTDRIGKLFGPIMLVWFFTLAVLGFAAIVKAPMILKAISPSYAVALFVDKPWIAFVSLGSVVLAVTGCEALYADMGHFGRLPIRLAWLVISLPALLLDYFGQGAELLMNPKFAPLAFYSIAPGWAHYPLVILATAATIIASQAVISGVFSITRQAVQLGQLPRMEIRHTSVTEAGQIYVPRSNAMLCIGVVASAAVMAPVMNVLLFAYGIGEPAHAGVKPLPAPQANLVRSVAEGMFGGTLPVNMIVIGAVIGALIIMLDLYLKRRGSRWSSPVLAVAVGIYLPLDVSTPILAGGIVAEMVARWHVKNSDGGDHELLKQNGMLFAAGLITGEALVGEHERLTERVNQMLERVEASLKQCLRLGLMDSNARADTAAAVPLPADYDPAVRASLLVSYIVGRWHRYARSGFVRMPDEHADAQLRLILQ